MLPCRTPLNGFSSILKPEQAAGVAGKDGLLLRLAEPGLLFHHFHRTRVSHVKAVIAADHHPICARQPNQVCERIRGMGNGIVVKSAQVGEGAFLQVPAFLPHPPAVMEAPHQVGKGPSGMGPTNIQFGKTIEHAPEN